MSVHKAYIFDSDDEIIVELHDDLKLDTLLDIEDQWAAARNDLRIKLRAAGVTRESWPQSLHWDWGQKGLKLALAGDPDDYRIMAIRRQAVWEAAMVTLSKNHLARLAPDLGKPLIYVDYLEIAPWNWPVKEIGQVRKFGAVGATMLRPAIEQSYTKGWDGRVGLHALPQAAPFYTKQQFAFVANDVAKQNLPYYELSASAAANSTGRR